MFITRLFLFLLPALLAPGVAAAAAAPAAVPETPAAPALPAQTPDPAGVEFFEKKVRPVLVQHCYKCHSAEADEVEGQLLLDTRAGVLAGGETGPAVVPGRPDESRLIKAVRYNDQGLQMPPKDRLPAEVIADLEAWVAMGAPDPREGATAAVATKPAGIDVEAGRKLWAFSPLTQVEPPALAGDTGWAKTPVDRFILARQQAKGVTPNPQAGRETLIRRAYYDLTGLPPTPEEVDAFVNDAAPDAWEKLIDRLLASPRYGERWARHWLDAVRYAESGGYEFDGDRPGAHHYRDFVIRAFNADMPYDQFVRLQLAGDKLIPGHYNAGAATGFLVAGPYPGQTTAKTLEPIRYDHLDDIISTVGSSMLGLSLGCARCHDHKYDPISQQDYYRLIACLAQTDSAELQLDPKPEVYAAAKAQWDAARVPLVTAWDQFVQSQFPARLEQWRQQKMPESMAAVWLSLDPVSADNGKGTLKEQEDGSVLAPATADPSETYTLVAHTNLKQITGLKIETLADPSLPMGGPGRAADGDFVLTRLELRAAPLNGQGGPVDVVLKPVAATAQAQDRALAGALDADPNTGWAVGAAAGAAGKDQAAVFETEGDVGFDGGAVLTFTLRFENAAAIGRVRVGITTAPRPAALAGASAPQAGREVAALLDAAGGAVTDQNREQVLRWFRGVDADTRAAYAPLEQHLAQEPKPQLAGVFAAGDRGGPVFFLVRGETGKKKDQAVPGFIQVLMNAPERDARWAGDPADASKPPVEPRVALASWITDPRHGAGHLLARVIVNRLWQHHMGTGLVATPNDFGVQGEPPTHPELLDYLASELIKSGWRLKPVHKLIMASAVYTQGGAEIPSNLAADPDNKLWWRRPSRRLEAEAVRDALLAVSGSLQVDDAGGPATADENSPRRSVYLRVKRSQPIPLMVLFDAPEAIQSTGQRQVTTVATQALTMMNSPFVRQRAEQLARRVRPDGGVEVAAAVEQAYRVAVSRRPTEAEKAKMLAFIERQAATYNAGDPKAGVDQALADFCQVLLSSNEFVYVD